MIYCNNMNLKKIVLFKVIKMRNEVKIIFKNVFVGQFANRRIQAGKHSQQFILYFFNNGIFENVLLRY